MATASHSVVCLAWHHARRLRNKKTRLSNGTKNTIGLYLKFLSYPLPKKVESPFLSMSSPALRDVWSRCERQHGERRGRRLFWVSLGGYVLRSRRSQLQRPKQWWIGEGRPGGATEKATTKKATETGKGRCSQWRGRSVDVVHGFIAPVEFDFRICVPLRFCLRYRRLETLLAYAGEGGRGEWCGLLATWKSSRSWRTSSATHTERHEGRARGIAWRRAR